MQLTVALFGIAREIVGQAALQIEAPEGQRAGELLATLRQRYPALARLRSCAVAVNSEYADDQDVLQAHDEIALIPPVAGG